jgi:hypothetical protein
MAVALQLSLCVCIYSITIVVVKKKKKKKNLRQNSAVEMNIFESAQSCAVTDS